MFELAYWQKKAATLAFPDQALIDGKLRAAQSGQTFAAVNPATGQRLADVAACGVEDADVAVSNARQVFEAGTWAARSPAERKQVLLRLAEDDLGIGDCPHYPAGYLAQLREPFKQGLPTHPPAPLPDALGKALVEHAQV